VHLSLSWNIPSVKFQKAHSLTALAAAATCRPLISLVENPDALATAT
jgi:hypothetical protein